MNNTIVKDEVVIENMIYEISDVQVILDFNLSKLYHCGSSINRIVYKTFPITLINNNYVYIY